MAAPQLQNVHELNELRMKVSTPHYWQLICFAHGVDLLDVMIIFMIEYPRIIFSINQFIGLVHEIVKLCIIILKFLDS